MLFQPNEADAVLVIIHANQRTVSLVVGTKNPLVHELLALRHPASGPSGPSQHPLKKIERGVLRLPKVSFAKCPATMTLARRWAFERSWTVILRHSSSDLA